MVVVNVCSGHDYVHVPLLYVIVIGVSQCLKSALSPVLLGYRALKGQFFFFFLSLLLLLLFFVVVTIRPDITVMVGWAVKIN